MANERIRFVFDFNQSHNHNAADWIRWNVPEFFSFLSEIVASISRVKFEKMCPILVRSLSLSPSLCRLRVSVSAYDLNTYLVSSQSFGFQAI